DPLSPQQIAAGGASPSKPFESANPPAILPGGASGGLATRMLDQTRKLIEQSDRLPPDLATQLLVALTAYSTPELQDFLEARSSRLRDKFEGTLIRSLAVRTAGGQQRVSRMLTEY